jgi:hypothetical protein
MCSPSGPLLAEDEEFVLAQAFSTVVGWSQMTKLTPA